jgi:hypothetical protein
MVSPFTRELIMIFCTAITEDYFERAKPLIDSFYALDTYFPEHEHIVVTLNWTWEPELDDFSTIRMNSKSICTQAGQVLDVLPDVADTETLVMCDADAVFQRDLTVDEHALLWNLCENQIAVGPNHLKPGSGLEELRDLGHLSHRFAITRIIETDLRSVPIYNCGFIAAKIPTWRALRRQYDKLVERTSHILTNWRAVQLQICIAIKQLNLHVVELPRTIHSHLHDQPHPLHLVQDGKLYYDGKLVFFAHHF